jgi:hypothetical protein
VDCSNWPLELVEEWSGVGGVVELSKVESNCRGQIDL